MLFLKDEHSLCIDETYKVYYYSPVGEEGAEDPQLFGFPACNLYKEKRILQKLEKALQLLSQFNVYMDLAIEGHFAS